MSKINGSKNNLSGFISSKGFYVAIVVCLAGAGFATWLAVDRTIDGIESQSSRNFQNESRISSFPALEEAAKPQSDIPRASSSQRAAVSSQAATSGQSAPSSSASNQQSSSAPSSVPAASSEASVPSPPLVRLVYALPVKGDILNAFSAGELVRNITLGDWRTHDGVDIACEKGSEVITAAEGRVLEAGFDSLWGGIVTIEHPDGRQTVYSGLAEPILVKPDESVASRQVIGTVGGVPCESAEAIHIHFSLKENGKWADPLSLIARAD